MSKTQPSHPKISPEAANDSIPKRFLVGLALLAILDICWRLLPADLLETTATPLWIAYFAIGCLFLGKRLGLFLFATALAVGLLYEYVNRIKIQLTEIPITFDDVIITAMNPNGFWEAIGASTQTRVLTYAILATVVATIGLLAASGLLRLMSKRHRFRFAAIGLFLLLAWFISIADFAKSHYVLVDGSKLAKDMWEPRQEAKLARQIGSISYFNYSYQKHKDKKRGDIFDIAPPADDIAGDTPPASAATFKPRNGKPGNYPNIVFMLLESTFEINKAFELSKGAEDPLFTPNGYTKLLTPLRVNVVGGGTWTTEFETITGMDSRIFGYYGNYIHSNISPFIRNSFASYLSGKGYSTTATYPVSGAFFNARSAYKNYGFSRFYDAGDLGLSGQWDLIKDPEVVRKAIEVLGSKTSQPFFGYVLTLENHSPHPCINHGLTNQPKVTLLKSENFPGNCSIDEYLYRLRSTSKAVFAMRDFLEQQEEKTGRPFVLVVFGDHQPHTFTSTGDFQYDFSRFRTTAPKNETFVHIMSSVPGSFDCCKKAVPAFLLPSLVATMIAKDTAETYLPIDLSLYEKCGPDVVGAYRSRDKVEASAAMCRRAYPAALDFYRRNIVNLK